MDTLESIITDLLNEVFKNTVSIEDLVKHLKYMGGIDLERISIDMIFAAIKNNELSQTNENEPTDIDWHGVGFGCDETLCHCNILSPEEVGIDPSKEHEEKLEMCSFLLAVGLLAQAARMRNMQLSDYLYFNKIMHALFFYCDYPNSTFDVEHHIERLLKHIYRPGCP